jgi:hypothetical protein
LIGGLPLLQTLAMVFSCVPVPFAKNGGFNFAASRFGRFLSSIKNLIQRGIDGVKDFFSQNFINPIRDGIRDSILSPLDRAVSSPFNDINEQLEKLTANNYAGLEASLPSLFSRTEPSVVTARNRLLECIGKIGTSADNYKIGPFMLGELVTMAQSSDSLAKAMREFEQHTDNLSGLGGSGTALELERLYGNVVYTGATANIASSNQVSPNLSASVYPIVDIGDTIVIDSLEKIVIDKNFTAAPAGTVSVNVSTDNVKVTSASVSTLNLASCLLDASGTISLNTNMYISVNGEVRQVNTINSLGDYLTVYNPFYNSASGQTFFKETSFNVNTAFATTDTDLEIKVRKSFVCNSICLDNVITGQGTSFTSQLQANNKILYDAREYIVTAVTDTTITVDDYLRATKNFAVYKVTNETPFVGLDDDLVDPDGIINAFTLPGSITGDPNFMDGVTTRVRRANGIYQSVNASKPIDAAQSLFQNQLMERTREILNQMKYDLRDDAIRSLTDSQTVTAINNSVGRILSVKDEIRNIVEQDIAVLNQAKNLVKGMVKLFSLSCSKKKRKDSGENDSDEYLNIILYPNPERQGCAATTSDFIEILDDFDAEYNDPGFVNNPIAANTVIPNFNELNDLDGVTGPFPRQTTGIGEGEGDAGVDNQDPDVNVPEDPCAKPC